MSYCLFGFSKEGCLRATARGYPINRIRQFEKDERNKGNTCIVATEDKWELVPQKYKDHLYHVKSKDCGDMERIRKHLKIDS